MLVVGHCLFPCYTCSIRHDNSRKFEKMYRTLIIVETWMDVQAYKVKTLDWIRGLWTMGFEGAHKAAAGLA